MIDSMIAIANFPKKPDYQVDMALLKSQERILESIQGVMMSNRYLLKEQMFAHAMYENYLAVCEKDLSALNIENAADLLKKIGFVLSLEGYQPSWYIHKDSPLIEIVKVSVMEPLVRHLNYYKNAGCVGEVMGLEAEMQFLKTQGTSAEGLKKWKDRIKKLKASSQYKDNMKQVKMLVASLEDACKNFKIPQPEI